MGGAIVLVRCQHVSSTGELLLGWFSPSAEVVEVIPEAMAVISNHRQHHPEDAEEIGKVESAVPLQVLTGWVSS